MLYQFDIKLKYFIAIKSSLLMLCLHYVLGGHGSHVLDDFDQNVIYVSQHRGTR